MKTASPNEAKSHPFFRSPIFISSLAERLHSFISPSGRLHSKNALCLGRQKCVFCWWEMVDSDHRSRKTTDLQSAPFGHSGNLPYYDRWSWWTDLNPRPADYKSAALPTELHQQNYPRCCNEEIISQTNGFVNCFCRQKTHFFFIYLFFACHRQEDVLK